MKKIFKYLIIFLITITSIYSLIDFFYPKLYLEKPNHVQVYDYSKTNYYSLIGNNITSYVTLENVSEEFIKTIITIEDKRFFSHNGIDLLRVSKSFLLNFLNGEIVQGGSTITQQLVKMTYLDNSKTYTRKIKEAFLAKKIEDSYSKKEILEMYINNCYFSHNIYGIYLASQYYFNKNPSELNYSESSMLVGIINAPNLYAPDINLEQSIEKQQQILKLLYQNNVINSDDYYLELNRPLNLHCSFNNQNINLLYYQQGIQKELKEMNLLNNNYKLQGYIINSNLDLQVYETVDEIIKNHQKTTKNDQIAVVIMKPYSNRILALWGGFNYLDSSFNRAIESKRQIGSTIKPFLYYLGLENNMTPLSSFVSEETTFYIEGIGPYSPKNASSFYANRKINMFEALSLSDNIYAIKTTLLLGSDNLAKLLEKFNIKCDNVNPTIGLGSISLSPLELTSLYNCLASEGTYYVPSFIESVTLEDNTLLKKNNSKGKQILDSHQVLILNHMLKSPFDNAFASYTLPSLSSYQTNNTFAAKSGSTSSTNWVMGFNKDYTIGIYVGNDDNKDITSTKLARELFQEIANKLIINQKDNFYEPDENMRPITFYNSVNNKTSKVYYI